MSIYKSNNNDKDKQNNKDHHVKGQDKINYSEDEILDLMDVYRDRYKRVKGRVKRR